MNRPLQLVHRLSIRRVWYASLAVSLVMIAAVPAWAQNPPPSGEEEAAAQPDPADQEPAADPADPAAPPPAAPAPQAMAPEVAPGPAMTFPRMSGNEIHLSDNFFFRPGFQLQHWTEALQDRVRQEPNGDSGEYQLNSFVRRGRVFFSGGFFKKVTFLLLFEAANIGRTATAADGSTSKTFNTLALQDAAFSLNLHPAFSIQAGLMLVPFTRNILQGTTSYLSLDVLTTSATYIAVTQTSALRDTGLQLKGQVLADRLEYRFGMFQGIRQSDGMGNQGGKNPFRLAGYVQYNFLDPEIGYVFAGEYFGHKRVAGVSAGFDYQKLDGADVDAYWAVSASAFFNIPLNGDPKSGGDDIAGLVQFLHFDPGTSIGPPPAGLAEQNDIAAELSYYNKGIGASLFGKYEMRTHSDSVFEGADLTIYGGGLKYFLAESAINLTLAYNRIDTPNVDEATEAVTNPVNQLVAALQFVYY